MNIWLCASKFKNNDIQHNANKIIELLKKKSTDKIDFLFFGESFLHGFEALSWNYDNDILMKKETDKTIHIISEACKEHNRGVGFGYFEFDQDEVYSSYIVIDSNGKTLTNYRRISTGWRYPNVDKNIYKEGKSIAIFNYHNKKIGIGLCGDIWDNDLYNEYLNHQFDVFIWPVYVNYDIDKWITEERTEYLKRSKSLGTHVLYINSVSDEPSYGGTYYQHNGSLIQETELQSTEVSLKVKVK